MKLPKIPTHDVWIQAKEQEEQEEKNKLLQRKIMSEQPQMAKKQREEQELLKKQNRLEEKRFACRKKKRSWRKKRKGNGIRKTCDCSTGLARTGTKKAHLICKKKDQRRKNESLISTFFKYSKTVRYRKVLSNLSTEKYYFTLSIQKKRSYLVILFLYLLRYLNYF